jgi:hypothetical protein
MDHFKSQAPDPRWDLALDIVRALELGGRYEVGVDTGNAQRVVDIRWAAHQAGRLLGVKIKVLLAGPVDGSDCTGTASDFAPGKDSTHCSAPCTTSKPRRSSVPRCRSLAADNTLRSGRTSWLPDPNPPPIWIVR